MKYCIYILLLTVLAACSSNSSIVSSFSQRKYTKGYFADAIGQKPAVTGIKASKAEDKKALASVIEKNNTVQRIAILKDSLKALQTGLAKASVSIRVKQKYKETNKGLASVEQVKGAPVEPSTPDANDDAKQRRTNGIVLLILAAIVFALGLLLTTFGGAGIIFILGGIFLAILGITKFATHPPANTDTKTYDSFIGGTGLILVIVSIVLGIIAALFLALALFGGASGTLILSGIAGLVVALALLIAGIVDCIRALNHTDKYRDCAIAGLVIAGIVILLGLLGIILPLLRL